MSGHTRYVGALYKVLTTAGAAPFVTGYMWSLPQCIDGVWVPGDWHEESTKDAEVCRKGLHITAYPFKWRAGEAGHVVWHVEAEGVLGDPMHTDKVIAARVRLLRPVTAEELQKIRDDEDARDKAIAEAYEVERAAAQAKWEAEAPARAAAEAERIAHEAKRKAEYEEYERQERREKMQRLAKAAKRQREEVELARFKGIKSPAQHTFAMLEAVTGHSSWREINSARYAALKYLVEFVGFERDDFGAILNDFNGGRWIGENGAESLYNVAIESKNASAALSIEKHLGRKPFWRMYGGKKLRTGVGDQIRVDGRWLKVTSFRDDKGYLNAQEYRRVKRDGYHEDERVGGVVRVTHAQLLAGSTKAASVEASP